MYVEILGFLAAILTTSAYLPQAYKIWKTKNAESVSLTMYLVMFLGIFLWLIYSLFIKSFPLIIANTLTLLIVLFILYFKINSKNN